MITYICEGDGDDHVNLVHPCSSLLCQYIRVGALHRIQGPQPRGVHGTVLKGNKRAVECSLTALRSYRMITNNDIFI